MDFEKDTSFDAEIYVNGGMNYTKKLTVDIDESKVSPFKGKTNGIRSKSM